MRVGWFDYVRTIERPALESPERALLYLPAAVRQGGSKDPPRLCVIRSRTAR
jgi:hypothetical protein